MDEKAEEDLEVHEEVGLLLVVVFFISHKFPFLMDGFPIILSR